MIGARAVAGLLALAVLAAPALAGEGELRAGRMLLEDHCGSCHAISAIAPSPLEEAPAFREVVTRYPVADLEESLAEGIVTGHPNMPQVAFDPGALDAVMAYLEALAVTTEP